MLKGTCAVVWFLLLTTGSKSTAQFELLPSKPSAQATIVAADNRQFPQVAEAANGVTAFVGASLLVGVAVGFREVRHAR